LLRPVAWMDAGLTTNRGVFFLGQPGTGRSSGGKRTCRGLMAFVAVPLFLGDAKPDYTRLVRSAGGWVVRIGRGLDPDQSPGRRPARRRPRPHERPCCGPATAGAPRPAPVDDPRPVRAGAHRGADVERRGDRHRRRCRPACRPPRWPQHRQAQDSWPSGPRTSPRSRVASMPRAGMGEPPRHVRRPIGVRAQPVAGLLGERSRRSRVRRVGCRRSTRTVGDG
jgi:hypothetical protein